MPQELFDKVPAKNAVTVCEDDPSFLYKDKPGFDCAFLAANKPDKCLKLHGDETVGAASCPVSCGMVKECEKDVQSERQHGEVNDMARGDSAGVNLDETGIAASFA